MTSAVASLGEWCANELGGSMSEKYNIYNANCLGLREARHKHDSCNVWGRS